MLSGDILNNYKLLKQKKDAAYLVFKKEPTPANASRHSVATQAFTSFCLDTMEKLAGISVPDNDAEILADIERYRTCKQCEAELVYPVSEDHFVASSEFVAAFPGWCHTCLVDYCRTHLCEQCPLTNDYNNCPYKEIKNIYTEAED